MRKLISCISIFAIALFAVVHAQATPGDQDNTKFIYGIQHATPSVATFDLYAADQEMQYCISGAKHSVLDYNLCVKQVSSRFYYHQYNQVLTGCDGFFVLFSHLFYHQYNSHFMAKEILKGGVTQEEVTAWLKEHKKLHTITVTDAQGKEHTAYLKPLNRNLAAVVCSNYSKNQTLQAGEFILENCFLGGNQTILDNEDLKLSASVEANKLFDPLPASSAVIE